MFYVVGSFESNDRAVASLLTFWWFYTCLTFSRAVATVKWSHIGIHSIIAVSRSIISVYCTVLSARPCVQQLCPYRYVS